MSKEMIGPEQQVPEPAIRRPRQPQSGLLPSAGKGVSVPIGRHLSSAQVEALLAGCRPSPLPWIIAGAFFLMAAGLGAMAVLWP